MSGPYPTTYSNNLQMSEQPGGDDGAGGFLTALADLREKNLARGRLLREERGTQGTLPPEAPAPVSSTNTQVQTDLSGPVGDAIARQAQVAQTAQQGGDSYSRILANSSL